MRRSLNKDHDVASATPGRRSLRHSKPSEEDSKSASPAPSKGRKSVGKKKEDKVASKNEDKAVANKNEEKAVANKNEDKAATKNEDKAAAKNEDKAAAKNNDKAGSKNETQIEAEENIVSENNASTKTADVETSTAKATTSRRSVRKRQLSEATENEADSEEKAEDEKEDNAQGDGKEITELKNGDVEEASKPKTKKKRKPPTKKKKVSQDEAELWTPLEPLDGDEKRDAQPKPQSKSDRRKQALTERRAPADPMLQKQPPRRRNSGASECEVLVNVPRTHRRSKTIVTVDIDDEASETGSIQIVAVPDVDSVFDFKRLLIQYRNVNLPSSLWGVHKDPRNLFVSFTRFNPDYPDNHGIIVDRTVVFNGSLNPEAFVNGEKLELPEMFNVVETIYEASQVIEFVNNTVTPVSHSADEATEETC